MNILGEDEWCCTSPLLRTGNDKYTLESAEHMVEKADGMGAKDIVMACSGCFKTIATDFGKYYSQMGQQCYHFTQYAEKLTIKPIISPGCTENETSFKENVG